MPDADLPTRAARIEATLAAGLNPSSLEVEDESARHAGHAGARAGGQTHYRIAVISDRFVNLSRIERSRLVHTLLAQEFDTGLHALSLTLGIPV